LASAKTPQEEWIFHQTSPQFGRQAVYVCHDAIKIVNIRYSFEIVANAPTWKLHAFRRDAKIICTVDKIDLESALPLGRIPKPGTCVLAGEQDWKGLPCKRYNESNSASTLTTNSVRTDRRANWVLCNYYNIPKFSEFPACNFWNREEHTTYHHKDWSDFSQFKDISDSSSYKFITTTWEKVPYNTSDFSIPLNYRVIPDMNEIVLGEQKKQIENMIDDLGFTSDTGNKKATQSGKQPTKSLRPN
jgi:hypothetical protein